LIQKEYIIFTVDFSQFTEILPSIRENIMPYRGKLRRGKLTKIFPVESFP